MHSTNRNHILKRLIVRTSRCFFYSLLVGVGFVSLYVVLRVFCVDYFPVSSYSMEPNLEDGDVAVVNKWVLGARMYKLQNFNVEGKLNSWRVKGYSSIRHNDIVIFNAPINYETFEYNISKVYVKRCVALPGDTIRIVRGRYTNNNYTGILGDSIFQQRFYHIPDSLIDEGIRYAFPYNDKYPWTIRTFGPLYIPHKGDVIHVTVDNIVLYRKMIEYETEQKISIRDGAVFLDKQKLEYYVFRSSYYFLAGDNVVFSEDSRYWGAIPEEYIIGVVSGIFSQENLLYKLYRWLKACV